MLCLVAPDVLFLMYLHKPSGFGPRPVRLVTEYDAVRLKQGFTNKILLMLLAAIRLLLPLQKTAKATTPSTANTTFITS